MGIIGKIFRQAQRFLFFRNSWNRLYSSVYAFSTEFNNHPFVVTLGKQDEPSWVKSTNMLIEATFKALDKNRIDEGWKCFHSALRMSYHGFDERLINAKACEVRREADEKLSSWRKKTIFDIIGDPNSPKQIDISQLCAAIAIRDEHADNRYYKMSLLRNHLAGLLCILIFLFSIMLVIINPSIMNPVNLFKLIFSSNIIQNLQDPYLTFWGTLFFGILGGTLSVALPLKDFNNSGIIPEYIAMGDTILFRILLGAAFATIISLFIHAGLQSVFSKEIADKLNPGSAGYPYSHFVLGLVAGFNERFVVKAINAMIGEK